MTEKKDLSTAFKSLLVKKAPSKAAQFRVCYPDIEDALSQGASYGEVLQVLAAQGIELTYKTLDTYLVRERKRLKSDVGLEKNHQIIRARESGQSNLPEPLTASETSNPEKPVIRARESKASAKSENATQSPIAVTSDPEVVKELLHKTPDVADLAKMYVKSKGNQK